MDLTERAPLHGGTGLSTEVQTPSWRRVPKRSAR